MDEIRYNISEDTSLAAEPVASRNEVIRSVSRRKVRMDNESFMSKRNRTLAVDGSSDRYITKLKEVDVTMEEKPNLNTMAAIEEARSSKELDTLRVADFDEFVKAL